MVEPCDCEFSYVTRHFTCVLGKQAGMGTTVPRIYLVALAGVYDFGQHECFYYGWTRELGSANGGNYLMGYGYCNLV